MSSGRLEGGVGAMADQDKQTLSWKHLDVWPRVVVFDLDSTVWDGDIELTHGPPFHNDPKGFRDARKQLMELFPDCLPILSWLDEVHEAQKRFAEKRGGKRGGEEGESSVFPWEQLKDSFPDRKAVEKGEAAARAELNKISIGSHSGTPHQSLPTREPRETSTREASTRETTTQGESSTKGESSTLGEDGTQDVTRDVCRLMEVGWASRPDITSWAPAALKVMRVKSGKSVWEVSKYSEIYPGDKKRHLRKIAEASGCDLREILFFDNEYRNIRSALELNVTGIYTPDGLNATNFIHGLLTHAHKITHSP